MTVSPTVSIVTPVRNAAATLARCLDSVVSQSVSVIEHIVVDGHSDDGSREMLRRREGDFLSVIDAPPRGIADAFNRGIAAARGDVIGIVNADDWYEPGAIAAVRPRFDGRAMIVHGRVRLHDIRSGMSRLSPGREYREERDFRPLERMPAQHPSCFVSRAAYDLAGVFTPCFRLAMDYEFLLRCHRAGIPFLFVPDVIVNHSSGGASSVDPRGARREVLAAQVLHTRRLLRPLYLFAREEWRGIERRIRRSLPGRRRDVR